MRIVDAMTRIRISTTVSFDLRSQAQYAVPDLNDASLMDRVRWPSSAPSTELPQGSTDRTG